MKTQEYTLPQASVGQLMSRILATYQITQTQQECLWQLMLSGNSLNSEEISQLRLVFDHLQKGFLKIECL